MERSFGIQLVSTPTLSAPFQLKRRSHLIWRPPLLIPCRLLPICTCAIHSVNHSSSSSSSKNNKRFPISIQNLDKELKVMVQKASTLLAPPGYQVHEIFKMHTGTLLLVTAVIVAVAVLRSLLKPVDKANGSVADLVKRGQLRSDRRSDSRLLKYEDPFNNPFVKVNEGNSVVKMYGKEFKLQPVTLTQEKMQSHQSRRVQAYQWKRPTVFLVEGDPIPDGVDPDTVRWIPPNHPFATTKNDIDEKAAEKNVYQTRGVPYRVRAEHEALRKKMLEEAEQEPAFQFPLHDSIDNSERKTNIKTAQPLFEQSENGLGSRPIKPFEKLDGKISPKFHDNPPGPPTSDAD